MNHDDYQKQLVTFLADKGFIYGPEPEIYGGVAGFYTYGPLGKSLKNKLENTIRSVFSKYGFWEVECPIVQPKIVWEASGHLGGFSDPLIKDEKKSVHRVDKLIEEWARKNDVDFQSLKVEGATKEHLLSVITEHKITAPNGTPLVMEIFDHSLMMRTTVGVDGESYNRPETATTTYLPFSRYVNFFRNKTPFGVFQIGKAFRNEISPRQNVLRGREFTQAEGQLFILESEKHDFEKFDAIKLQEVPLWTYQAQDAGQEPQPITMQEALENGSFKNKAYAWTVYLAYELFVSMGVSPARIRLRQHNLDERAFYADDAWDIEIKLESYGWMEACGVHDRTTYDLDQHAKFSKKELVLIDDTGKRHVPHVLEIAFGVDRPLFALLDNFYKPAAVEEGKPKLALPYPVSPVEVAVLPLVNKEEILTFSHNVLAQMQQNFICQFDKSGSIGKRYVRQDEIGTPFCITVDFDSLEDESVTVRDRNSQEQARVKVSKLVSYIKNAILTSN